MAIDSTSYKYDISLTYSDDSDPVEIDSRFINSIMIDYDYKNNNMPIVFANISLDNNLLYRMSQNIKTGSIILKIQKIIHDSEFPVSDVYIQDRFIYFLPEDLSDMYNDPDRQSDDISGGTFTKLTIGLMSLDILNNNKKTISGIISDTDMFSLVYYVLGEERSLIIEPFQNNRTLNDTIIPIFDSKSKILKYLNSINCFYNTSYRYFMDFNVTYLLSSSGAIIKKQGDEIHDILITLEPYKEDEAMIQGIIIDSDAKIYKLYVSEGNAHKLDNTMLDKRYNTMIAVDGEGTKESVKLSSSGKSLIKEKKETVKVFNDNLNILSNLQSDIDNSVVNLVIDKTDIDSSILTLNRKFNIDATRVYGSSYNGNYLLIRKRELYLRDADNFTLETIINLNKTIP